MLEELRIAACLSMLAIAAIIDFKKREIPDKIWIGFGALGILLFLVQYFGYSIELGSGSHDIVSNNLLTSYFLGIGIMSAIAFGIYRTSLFGGADSKALVVIALLVPSYDGGMAASFFKLHGITALTVLTNALIISMSHVAYNLIRNTIQIARGIPIFEGVEESSMRKAAAFAMGFTSNAPRGYLFAMEDVDKSSGKRKFRFNPAGYDDFVAETDNSKAKCVWVTPALPFIVYIAIGFVVTVFVTGDLMGLILQSLM